MYNKTARQVYIEILTELNKEEAPTLYLEDYLYYYNKSISEYMKSRYEMFEVNQQLSDDMRCWKKDFNSTLLSIPIESIGAADGHSYRHLVSCIVDVELTRPVPTCSQAVNTTKSYKVTRMSSGIKAGILNNDYLKPTFYRPYFEIINNNIVIDLGDISTKSIKISNIRIEYLKQPVYVDLTECEVSPVGTPGCDKTSDADTSQVLEFTGDVGDEITKVALKLIMERGMNPRMQSNVAVNQSISDISTGLRGGK